MTRLRIYSAGTGRLQFDSSGSAEDVTESSVKRDFKSDLLLYYDPGRDGLRCYVKLIRNGSEQFMADYEFEPGTSDPLEAFRSTLEREIDEVGWRVERDAGYEQRLYESIGSATEVSPDVSTADLEYLLETEGQIRLGTSDEAGAIGVVSYVRRVFGDSLDVAVTYSGETGTHGSVDVVVIPGATERVTVTRDQRAALARWRLGEVGEAVSTGATGGTAAAMRHTLVDAGAEDRLGVAIDAQDTSLPGTIAGWQNAVFTALALVPLAILAVVARRGADQLLPALTRRRGFYVPLAREVNGVVPDALPRHLFDFTSWHIVVISVFVVGVAFVTVPSARRTLTAFTGVSIPGDGVVPGSRGSGSTAADRATAAVDELVALRRTAENDRWEHHLDDVLGEFGLEAGSQSARARTALAVKAAGVAVGVVVAVAAFLVTSAVAGTVFGVVMEQWDLVLTLFAAGGFVAAVGTVGTAALLLVAGPRGGARRSRPETVTGAGLNGTGPDNDEVHAERPEPTMKVRDLPKRSQSDRTGSNSGREARPGSTREPSRNPETEPDSAERGDPVESENDGVGGQEIDETEAEDRLYPPEQTETGITPGENVDSGGTDTNVAGSSVDGLDLGHDDGGDDPSSDRRTETGRDPLSNTTDRSTTGTATPESAPDVIPTGGDEPIEVVGGSERIGQSFDAGKGENRGANARTAPGDETEVDREREVGIGTSSGRRARAVGFPQFRYDAANTGDVGSDVRTIRAPTQRWDPVVLEEECTATPVIRDDYLVVGTRKGRLHAISLVDGGHEQVATTDGALVASPALVDDHVVVVTTDGAVAGYRVGTDGDQLVARESWRYGDRVGRNTTTASPTVAGCRVFVAGEDGAVHAIDGDTGDAVWDGPYEAGASVMLSAPAVVDGTVYVTTKAGRLHAIDAATGAERWTESLGSAQVLASPAVVNGRLLVGDCRGTLSVVDVSEGSVVRTVAIGDEILSSAAVRDGTAYVAGNVGGRISERTDRSLDVETERARSERAVVTALDTTAGFDRRWTRELDAVTIASPTIVGDGLFVGTSGGRLFGLDRRSGEPLWDSPVGFDAGIESSVAAAGGGLYVPDHDGTVRSVVDRHD